MMELPFEIFNLLRKIQAEPAILVFFAAFHPVALLILVILPLSILKKIGLYQPNEKMGSFGLGVALTLAVGWIMGFVSSILFLFMGVSGIKMILIYLALYACIIAFVMANNKTVLKAFEAKMNQLKINEKK